MQFFAKCGILKEDDEGKPRVKLYKDRASGMLKGDGLVYYLKQPSVGYQNPLLPGMMQCQDTDIGPPRTRQSSNQHAQEKSVQVYSRLLLVLSSFLVCSCSDVTAATSMSSHVQVDLACKILDGGPFRDDPNKVITVQPAKFEMHGDTYVPKKKKAKKKKKVVKEDKVLGWGGFDDLLPPTQVRVPRMRVLHPMPQPPQRSQTPELLVSLGVPWPSIAGTHRSVTKSQAPAEVHGSSQELSSDLLSIAAGLDSSNAQDCQTGLAMPCR